MNRILGRMARRRAKIPVSVAEQALVRLMRVGDRLWRESDERFRHWDLTDNHYNVLRILNGAGEPLRQVEIGRRMLSSRANVTKVVDHLETLGLVKRLDCADRRTASAGTAGVHGLRQRYDRDADRRASPRR